MKENLMSNLFRKITMLGLGLTLVVSLIAPVVTVNAAVASGDLVKVDGNSAVYLIQGTTKRTFPHESIYYSWYKDFSTVKTITQAELDSYTLGNPVPYRPGVTFRVYTTGDSIGGTSNRSVYVMGADGKVLPIQDEATYIKFFAPTDTSASLNASKVKGIYTGEMIWKGIFDVPGDLLARFSYPVGANLTTASSRPEGMLFKYAGSDKTYIIRDGKKCEISSTGISANGYDKMYIVTGVPATESYADGAAITGMETALNVPATWTVTATGGALSVNLSGDTPASNSVAAGASANFTKLTLTTGGNAVSVNSIYVTRGGYSSNTDLENIKIVDMNGGSVGNVGSLNSDNKAVVTFSPALELAANSTYTYFLRAGVVAGTTASKTASLSIASSADINSNASSINGSFPIVGNQMTVVSLTIGTAAVDSYSPVSDAKPNAGDKNVPISRFKVTANSTEGLIVESLSLIEAGTAALSDYGQIELWSLNDNRSLGKASWNAQGKVTFGGLSLVIDKGNDYRFEVRTDIVSGSGKTMNVDLTDGSDIMMNVKGSTYGFYITPTLGTVNWTGKNGAGATAVDQNINTGSLTVSKSSVTPATGNVAPADNQVFTTWDFEAKGEAVKITSLKITVATTSLTYDEITNVKIYDEDGKIVAGPKDLASNATVTFTDLIIVPVGTHRYTVKAKLANTVTTNDAAIFGIADPSSDIVAKGYTTNDTVAPTPATAVNGNQQVVRSATLTVVNLTQPAAAQVTNGLQDYIWSTASFSATNSGENINVTAVTMAVTYTSSTTYADLRNVELWADLTSGTSERGDKYETKISNTEQLTATTKAITLTQTLVIPKGTYKEVALIGDFSADVADAGSTITVKLANTAASAVTASGVDTGKDISSAVTPSGNGQAMTVSGAGTLTVATNYGSSLSSALIAGNTEGLVVNTIRLSASKAEDIKVKTIKLTNSGSDNVPARFYLYNGTELLDEQPGGDPVTFDITEKNFIVPKNSDKTLTVKIDVNGVDGTTVANTNTVVMTVNNAATDVTGVGQSSGSAIAGTAGTYSNPTFTLYNAYPKFAVKNISPLTPGPEAKIAAFDVTAVGNKDIVFNSTTNALKVHFSAVGAANATTTVKLKDADANILSTTTTTNLSASATSYALFDFSTNPFVIAQGTTKTLYVCVDTDTAGLTTADKKLTAYLEATAADIKWSIGDDPDTAYQHGDLIFKGNLVAPALTI